MTRPAGARIPRYWSPWRWTQGARSRWAFQTLCWAVDIDAGYQGA